MALVVQISTYEELKKIIAESGKEYDREQIEAAYRLAEEKHREQKRSSGEPYIIHPLSVAAILVGLGMDSQSVMAGLLHDVVEDTDCTLEDIQKQFGKEVALLIDGVTKLGKIPYSSREEQQAETLVNDLLGAWRTNDGDYFLGSIVLVQHTSCDDVDIIDGQQRLTTL